MAHGIITRKGGGKAKAGANNFNVLYGSVLPNSAKPNDIFVKTTVPIQAVIMGVSRPTTAVIGSLFLDILYRQDSSTMNIGEDKTVLVTIGNVTQFDGTNWLLRDSWVWRNNTWVPIIYQLYNAGNQYINIGGNFTSQTISGSPDLSFNEKEIYYAIKANSGCDTLLIKELPIDVTDFASISAIYSYKTHMTNYNTVQWTVRLSDTREGLTTTGQFTEKTLYYRYLGQNVVLYEQTNAGGSADILAITGYKYIAFRLWYNGMYSGAVGNFWSISNIRLNKQAI